MCLVIDTCCLGMVFDPNNTNHRKFRPINDWITKGKGQVIYGGGKYKQELRRAKRYFSLLVELRRKGSVIELSDEEVDNVQEEVRGKETDPDFDDPHIIAIVIVSKCQVVCTTDTKLHPFLKKRSLYPKGSSRPKIYSGLHQKTLISDNNIVGVCLEAI